MAITLNRTTMSAAEGFSVRPCRPDDLNSLFRVCLCTGDAGHDASALYHAAPDALGERWTGAYATMSGCLAFVLEDREGVCGYTLAAVDSKEFYARFRGEWLDAASIKYPQPDPSKKDSWSPMEVVIGELYNPTYVLTDEMYQWYPSHLHIDLLPRAQGKGNGKALMQTLLTALRESGSRGVHLEMAPTNQRAHRFYTKLGFTAIEVADEQGDTSSDSPLYLGLHF